MLSRTTRAKSIFFRLPSSRPREKKTFYLRRRSVVHTVPNVITTSYTRRRRPLPVVRIQMIVGVVRPRGRDDGRTGY